MSGRDGAERIRSVGVDWILIAVAVVGPPAGIFFGHWLARKATKEDWERNSQVRRENRLREDSRRCVGSDRVACGYGAATAAGATAGRWLSSLVESSTGRDSSKML